MYKEVSEPKVSFVNELTKCCAKHKTSNVFSFDSCIVGTVQLRACNRSSFGESHSPFHSTHY